MNTNILLSNKAGRYTIKHTKNFLDEDITRFVSNTYYTKDYFRFSEKFDDVFKSMLKEDKLFKDTSVVVTVYDENNNIQGTVRKIYASNNVLLPIEREFDINLVNVIKENLPINNIYEIARFANKNNNTKTLMLLLHGLFVNTNENDLVLASLDDGVLKGLRKLGINFYNIGTPKQYLGSMTCPVALKVSSITGRFSYENVCKSNNLKYEKDI